MSLDTLKQQRASVKKNITRIKNLIEANGRGEGKTLSVPELKCRLGILDAYFKQILSIQTQIEKEDDSDSARADLEEIYILTKVAIHSQLGEEHNSTFHDSSHTISTSSSKLPKLKLPSFSGRYADYKNFISSFTQIIDREYSLSNIEKFNHLLNCLQGQALETVKAFPITSENYPKALDRLKSRYDNSTLIFLENISSLFELPSISKPHAGQLRSLVDNFSALYGSLQSLGSNDQISQAMLIYLILQKVDEETKKKWKESLDFKTLPSWNDCTAVLERHCQYLESVHPLPSYNERPSKNKQNKPQHNFSLSCSSSTCPMCSSSNHKLMNCDKFKSLDAVQRFDNAKRLGLCINCLSKGHQLSKCPSRHKCRICSLKHHSLLHRNSSTPTRSVVQASTSVATASPAQEAAVHTHLNGTTIDHVILATAMVLVRDSTGCYHLGRALLDSCSQVNFITDEFSQKLNLCREKQNLEIRSIGSASTNIKYKASTTIKSKFNEFEFASNFCVTSHIAYQPETEIDISTWKLPSNVELADREFYKSKRIDLLLGTETFFSILSMGQIKLGENLPVVQKTLLGWIVSGKYQEPAITSTESPRCLLSCGDSLDNKLERLWKLEEVSAACPWTPEQRKCEQIFMESVSRSVDGRIIVKIPFKDSPTCLGRSYDTALQRFLAQERRLARSPKLHAQYISFMDEYEKLGHMSLARDHNLKDPHYYIPHHYVEKPSSTSTKLRVVFDASCKTTSQKSLNEIQMVGPTLQSDLFMLLLRFRLFRYAITADIAKMYRQVLVATDDRKFQYILWRSSQNEEIRTYELNTVTYGMAAAPYLAIRSLLYLAEQFSEKYKIGADAVKSSFYVDDFLCGADNLSELRTIKYEVTELLKHGCFDLLKWHSNHQNFRDDKTIKDLDLKDESITSALGMKWDQDLDNFLFSFAPKTSIDSRVTKRSILSIASSLFDPMGLLAPIIITAKIILQELWLLKLDWDESVPQNLHVAWTNFLDGLLSLSSVSIPRYCLWHNSISLQIHGFCDSSIRAYGCCIYIRSVDNCGMVHVRLLTAKSRVAPTKKQSLPKLELCGAHLLAQIYSKIKILFEKKQFTTFLWTDSQIVLHWLQLHSATLSTFVGNRVSEIQDLTSDAVWKHVPSQCNPADLVSRGTTVEQLIESMWYTGPPFLLKDFNFWPKETTTDLLMEEVEKEKRKATFKINIGTNYILDKIEKYSSHLHVLRIVAWMFRFHRKLKKEANELEPESPSPQELQHAMNSIIWNLQQKYFSEDIRLLKKGELATSTLRSLNPFLEDVGVFTLLKVGGRLELSDLPHEQKHPILMPGKCEFTIRYIRYLHLKNYHAGAKALIALIRLEYWIVNARDVARRVVKSCVHCTRYKPKLLQQLMGNLPVERLTPSRPFARCGMDFCGPVNIYLRIRGKQPYKAYIAIFICLSSKAVHIEIVSDLTTEAFLAALKRMIGRRGLPSDLFCDNATNFVGAANKLAELKDFLFHKQTQNSIIKYCSSEYINFHFIPPRAPHFGGIWEAAVKSAKGLLHRTLGNTRLTFEEMSTALVEIEAILNSRPISPLSSDPSDFEALTPAHFIIGSSFKSLPEHMVSKDMNNLDKWARVSAIKQHFWKRWSHEYINELQTRVKWTSQQPNVTVGTMVIVHDDNTPPLHWLLGRIESCTPGSDGRIRVVDIRTTKGIIRRPVHKLAILHI